MGRSASGGARSAAARAKGGSGGSARAIAYGIGVGPSDPPEMTLGGERAGQHEHERSVPVDRVLVRSVGGLLVDVAAGRWSGGKGVEAAAVAVVTVGAAGQQPRPRLGVGIAAAGP